MGSHPPGGGTNIIGWTGAGQRVKRDRQAEALGGRWRELAEGRLDPAELDDEEVFEGRLRNADGVLGPRPRILPRELEQERMKRALTRGNELFRQAYARAVSTVTEVCSDPNQSAADRLKAAQIIMDRFAGKTPERLVLSSEDPIEALFRGILLDPEGLQEPVRPPKEPARDSL